MEVLKESYFSVEPASSCSQSKMSVKVLFEKWNFQQKLNWVHL